MNNSSENTALLYEGDWLSFEEDNEILSKVEERLANGVVGFRELNANELRPVIKCAILFRRMALNLAIEKEMRDTASINLGEPRKEKDNG